MTPSVTCPFRKDVLTPGRCSTRMRPLTMRAPAERNSETTDLGALTAAMRPSSTPDNFFSLLCIYLVGLCDRASILLEITPSLFPSANLLRYAFRSCGFRPLSISFPLDDVSRVGTGQNI